MKVKLLIGRPEGGEFLAAGSEPDLPQDEALRLISRGEALPVAETKTEKAVKSRKRAESR